MLAPTLPEVAFGHFVQSFSSQPLDIFFQLVTVLGHPAFWFAIAAFLYWKGEEKKSFFMALNILFAAAVVSILKNLTGRLRPQSPEFRVLGNEPDGNLSFPSGHATTVSSMLGYYWQELKRHERLAWLVLVILVMLSRVYLGQHYLGDVVVGALFGALIGRVVVFVEAKYSGVKIDGKKILEETGLAVAIIAAIVVDFFYSQFSLFGVLFGYFAGACVFKLLGMDSSRLDGRTMVAKQAIGFAGVAAIAIATKVPSIEAGAYFVAGFWVSLIYPLLWEKIAAKYEGK